MPAILARHFSDNRPMSVIERPPRGATESSSIATQYGHLLVSVTRLNEIASSGGRVVLL